MFAEKASHAAARHEMFVPGDLVVVGVSGGPDSTALLLWLTDYARERDISLHVAHLNHLLRGRESDEDALWVAELAGRLGWPASVEAVDVLAVKRLRRLSLEDAARQARYAFFARVVERTGGKCLAVGHTADDQVETVVLHWLRGTGLSGLRGMRPVMRYRVADDVRDAVTEIMVVRPLLEIWRDEVERYLQTQNIAPRFDRTNAETVFLRNRVRSQMIPILKSYNPRFGEAMLRLARIASDDYDFVQGHVASAWDLVARVRNREIVFDLQRFLAQPTSLRRYLLREAAGRLVGDVTGIGAAHMDNAASLATAGRTGSQMAWPRNLWITKSYTELRLGFREPRKLPELSAIGQRLTLPGTTRLAGTRWRVETALQATRCPQADLTFHADLDCAAVGPDLIVRRRRPGDRFRPLGMKQEKTLQDFLVDEKVPRDRRDDVPIVASPERIIWVVGLRIDETAKVTPETRTVLHLQFEQNH
ncbi:MAG: tRNA lysidine(34) synthetase TilS [Chloroflexi bacterium]|nr:tRNA lysidine(34) synthetase TilS [Chloroflexota bacterium]